MRQMKHLLNVVMSMCIALFVVSACSSSGDLTDNLGAPDFSVDEP